MKSKLGLGVLYSVVMVVCIMLIVYFGKTPLVTAASVATAMRSAYQIGIWRSRIKEKP